MFPKDCRVWFSAKQTNSKLKITHKVRENPKKERYGFSNIHKGSSIKDVRTKGEGRREGGRITPNADKRGAPVFRIPLPFNLHDHLEPLRIFPKKFNTNCPRL